MPCGVQKGSGYHLDLLVVGLLVAIHSFLGLPWYVAATVNAIAHINSLKKVSECAAPGEKPTFLGVRWVTGHTRHRRLQRRYRHEQIKTNGQRRIKGQIFFILLDNVSDTLLNTCVICISVSLADSM